MYEQISACRLCGSRDFHPILDLGVQALTGVFPRAGQPAPASGPLELIRCGGECGLVQLRHSFQAEEMYGANYGYRSSLNRMMVTHLQRIVGQLDARVAPGAGDVVLDIGSNDGTLLSFHRRELSRIGIDPTASKFRRYYAEDDVVVEDFFSAARFLEASGGRKARVITSIAMMYDLSDPLDFARQIAQVLDDEGVWFFEQSYLPSMIATTAYDTICHEHLEYYALRQISWMLERAGLRVIDVEINEVNGGSFAVLAAHAGSSHTVAASVAGLAASESERSDEGQVLSNFARSVSQHRDELRQTVGQLRAEGKRLYGYGASTKGNVILQYCGFTSRELVAVAEVNEDKFGCVTPGSGIPIIPEREARAARPDVFLVFPWHFRDFIVKKEQAYIDGGGALLFPLPRIELVSR